MAEDTAVPGPSNPKKPRFSVKKYYTDRELQKILEDSDWDKFDSDGGDVDKGDSSDYEEVNDDVTTQAVDDLSSDSDIEHSIDVPTGSANKKNVIIDWKEDPTDMKS